MKVVERWALEILWSMAAVRTADSQQHAHARPHTWNMAADNVPPIALLRTLKLVRVLGIVVGMMPSIRL